MTNGATMTNAQAEGPPAEEQNDATPAVAVDASDALAPIRARDPKTVVDSSVTQGNRLKTVDQVNPESAISQLEAKVKAHFDAVTPVIASVRALADELETLLNKLRVGI